MSVMFERQCKRQAGIHAGDMLRAAAIESILFRVPTPGDERACTRVARIPSMWPSGRDSQVTSPELDF